MLRHNLVKSTGVPTKIPDVMEVGLDGGSVSEQLNFAKEKFGEEFSFADCFEEGGLTDIVAVTKGMDGKVLSEDLVVNYNHTRTPRSEDNMVTWVTSVQDMSVRLSDKVAKQDIIKDEYNKRI